MCWSSIQISLRSCADSNGPELLAFPLLDSQFTFVLGWHGDGGGVNLKSGLRSDQTDSLLPCTPEGMDPHKPIEQP